MNRAVFSSQHQRLPLDARRYGGHLPSEPAATSRWYGVVAREGSALPQLSADPELRLFESRRPNLLACQRLRLALRVDSIG